ncbi:galectin-4-like [Ictalurus furcatus]|uniref:galectin-4-like n=1 Tax=Ictalurus furcatus TaxID=66913 RepID=UPI002350A886|nr:galectin-4-like [Ictalurus furcatus]
MVVESNEIQDMSLITGSLIDVPSEISHPISSPELPYVGAITGGLKTDMAVIFQGNIPADAKEFKINFQTGESDGENIAFHINPRIGELVALNSFRNGSWETEEHASIMPFAKEGALNMNIVINSEGYEVYVNGLQHCTFKHRIPLENVSTLGICGDVIINYFGFVENWSRSSLALENKQSTEMRSTSVTLLPITTDKLTLPFVGTIPGGIRADMAVLFYGTILADSNEFEINFQTCQSSDDIAFNINPQIVRFLVLSSLRNGEDLASDNGAAFNMFVVLKLEGYEVYVNGLQYCTFKHCIPLETISSLGIRGDVFINFIGFIDVSHTNSFICCLIYI